MQNTKYKVRMQNINTKYKFLEDRNRGRERRIVPAWQRTAQSTLTYKTKNLNTKYKTRITKYKI